jgi:hypothetical protein
VHICSGCMATANNRNIENAIARRSFVSEQILSKVTARGRRTLQKDRLLGTGPFPHYKLGRQVVYDLDECISIVEASRCGPIA